LVLRPFIDAYRVVAEELINLDPQRAVDEKQFFDRCLRMAKQWSLQHRIASKESVSLEMFATALQNGSAPRTGRSRRHCRHRRKTAYARAATRRLTEIN
jgi:glycerol-3-phosphate O-acyltransferase